MPKKYPEADRGEVGNQGLALLWMATRFFWKSSVLWEFMGVFGKLGAIALYPSL